MRYGDELLIEAVSNGLKGCELIQPIGLRAKLRKNLGKAGIIPASGNPSRVMDNPQAPQRLQQTEFGIIKFAQFTVAP